MLRFFLTVFLMLSCCICSLGTVEARTVALLPLINNVPDREELSQIYYDRAFEVMKKVRDVELVENQQLDQALAKYTKAGMLPDQAACEAIAQEGGVDLVVGMEINALSSQQKTAMQSSFLDISVKGNKLVYDATTGKYLLQKASDDKRMDAVFAARYDLVGETFGNFVTRELKRAFGVKKISFEKPRISGSGLRGNH